MAREIKLIDQILEQYTNGQLDVGGMSDMELHQYRSTITDSWDEEAIQDQCLCIKFLIEEELGNRAEPIENPETTFIARIANWSKNKFRRI
jgi:hypothetical protein